MSTGRRRIGDGTDWEDAAGYSRAARHGDVIAVSGTTAHGGDGSPIAPGDTYAQTELCLRRVIGAVERLGAAAQDVIRTRVLLAPDATWEDAARAHRDVFGAVRPANSMYFVGGLIGAGLLVEVEADAVVTGEGTAP